MPELGRSPLRASALSFAWRSIVHTCSAQQRQQRRVVARARADVEHPVVGRSASISSIRATTSGWEIVWPQAIGSATFS